MRYVRLVYIAITSNLTHISGLTRPRRARHTEHHENALARPSPFGLNLDTVGDGDDEGSDVSVAQDIKSLLPLCNVLVQDKEEREHTASPGLFSNRRLPHGADGVLALPSGAAFPAHQVFPLPVRTSSPLFSLRR